MIRRITCLQWNMCFGGYKPLQKLRKSFPKWYSKMLHELWKTYENIYSFKTLRHHLIGCDAISSSSLGFCLMQVAVVTASLKISNGVMNVLTASFAKSSGSSLVNFVHDFGLQIHLTPSGCSIFRFFWGFAS